MSLSKTDKYILEELKKLVRVYNDKVILDELKAIIEVYNDKWITIHPHGEDSDDYRRIKLEDGETPKEAIDRIYKKDKKEKSNNDYEQFHKAYYKDNRTAWTFKKEKGGTYSVTRYDEKGNYITANKSKKFDELDRYIEQFEHIKLDIPKKKIKGKNEFQEDLNILKSFEEKGFNVVQKYDDGYNIKYVLKNKNEKKVFSSQKEEIENLIKTKTQNKDAYLQAIKDYKKAGKKYEKTKSKVDMDKYLEAGKELRNKLHAYNKSYENNKNYVIKNSKPLAKNADIAGAKRGKPMTFKEANENKANPEYLKNPDAEKYNTNCQSTVLAYEVRRRGYDVKAVARNKFDKTQLLSENAAASFIDNTTQQPCEFETLNPKNSTNLYNSLNNTINENERYLFRYTWFNGVTSGGHVVTIERDENNNLAIYDPQSGRRKYKDEIKTYFSSYLKFNGKSRIGLLRVDDKELNEFFVNNGVLEKR